MECAQLAGAFRRPEAPQSGSKLHALQTLRAIPAARPARPGCRHPDSRSAWSAPSLLALSDGLRRPKAGASSTHSKRFARLLPRGLLAPAAGILTREAHGVRPACWRFPTV